MYLFFLEYVGELHTIALIEKKKHHTNTHTQDLDNEDDTTPTLMNQQGPIVHEQDPLVWPGMAIRYSGY
jgi:hypothetical protein